MSEVEIGIIITAIILGFGTGAIAPWLIPGVIGFVLLGLLWGSVVAAGWYMRRILQRYYAKLEKDTLEQIDESLNYRMPGLGEH